ncbi:MAG: hypothetical protein HY243_14260 [Proteobacteria bacterium]|nr:hypothetical protein [Pseudomonadota bacterium]
MRAIAAVALATVTLSGAHAQSTAKPTVKDLLAACVSEDQKTKVQDCQRRIGSFMAWGVEAQINMGYKAPGTPVLCFPITEEALKDKRALLRDFEAFEDAVVAWLKAHPEEQSKDEDTGIGDAATALYQCGRF